MIDVDAFKAYNDTYGHVGGDEVLRRVAAVIRENCARPADLPARLGGEEFSMILPATSPGGTRLLAEKVRRAIESLRIGHSGSPTSGFVTGQHWRRGHRARGRRQLQPPRRDSGLYQATRNGRN